MGQWNTRRRMGLFRPLGFVGALEEDEQPSRSPTSFSVLDSPRTNVHVDTMRDIMRTSARP